MTLWDTLKKEIVREFDYSLANCTTKKYKDWLRYDIISKCLHPQETDLGRDLYSFLDPTIINFPDHPEGDPTIACEGMSSVTIQQLYYMKLMKQAFGNRRYTNILEIGGGYGNGAKIWHEWGHMGTYTICDFPELHRIQKHFLATVCHKHIEENPKIIDEPGEVIFNIDGIERQSQAGMMNVEYKGLKDCWKHKGGLLQATFSMSEMPLPNRVWIENNLKNYDFIFIAHNTHFDGVDNKTYFEKLRENKLKDYTTYHVPCDVKARTWYLIAERNT